MGATSTTTTTVEPSSPSYTLAMATEVVSVAIRAEAKSDAAFAEFAASLGAASLGAFTWKTGGTGRETKTLAQTLPFIMVKKNGEVRHTDKKKCEALALKANVRTTDRMIVVGSVLAITADKGKVEAKEGDLFPAITIMKVINQLLNREVGFPAMLAAVKAVNKDESPTQAKAVAALRKLGVKAPAEKAEKAEEVTDDGSTEDEPMTPQDEFTSTCDAVITALDAVALLITGEDWQKGDIDRLTARLAAFTTVKAI